MYTNLTTDPEIERLCDTLFELSNEDRLSILRLILGRPLKLTRIAKELSLAVQETSRQLSRLVKVGLVTKNTDGAYIVTSQGSNFMRLLPSFQFLSRNTKYFETHSLEKLPPIFMGRIGELQEFKLVSGIMNAIGNIGKIGVESEEFCWYMTNQPLITADSYKSGAEMLRRGLFIKVIEQAGYSPPDEIVTKVSDDVRSVYREYRKMGKMTDLVLHQIDFILYMNEKEVGFLGFPLLDGSFNYQGFTSKDDSFVKWCKDLFQYYWSRGQPRDEFYIA